METNEVSGKIFCSVFSTNDFCLMSSLLKIYETLVEAVRSSLDVKYYSVIYYAEKYAKYVKIVRNETI